MAAPKGTRPPGGSRKGKPNRATADVKALAQKHTAEAIKELARLATQAESEPARVAAIKELLDRGHGKARQTMDVETPGGLVVQIVRYGADHPATE
jgi:hypothetical protein